MKPKNISVSLLSEATTLPSCKLIRNPVHPGILAGTDLWIKSGTHWSSSFGAELGYYYHRLYEHALLADSKYTLGYKFGFGLKINMRTSIGYKHSILSGQVYKFEGGKYSKAVHWGKAQFNMKAGLGLEFPVSDNFSITTDYSVMMALPYAPEKGMSFSLHSIFGLGMIMDLER